MHRHALPLPFICTISAVVGGTKLDVRSFPKLAWVLGLLHCTFGTDRLRHANFDKLPRNTKAVCPALRSFLGVPEYPLLTPRLGAEPATPHLLFIIS